MRTHVTLVILALALTLGLCGTASARWNIGNTNVIVLPDTVEAGQVVNVSFSNMIWRNIGDPGQCPWEVRLDATPGKRDGTVLIAGAFSHPGTGQLLVFSTSAPAPIPAGTKGGGHTLTIVSSAGEDWDPVYTVYTPRTIEVVAGAADTTPPTFTFEVRQSELRPPNHQMVLAARVSDLADDTDPDPVCSINVSSSEAANGRGDGNTERDWVVVKDTDAEVWYIWLRAERSGPSDGREYVIDVVASDATGNSSSASAVVTVAKDAKSKSK